MAQQQEDKTKRLLEIKSQIDQAKSKADRLRGTLEQLEGQLKGHGCKSLAEAKKLLDQMDKELGEKERELAEGMAALEKAYNWSEPDEMGFHIKDMREKSMKSEEYKEAKKRFGDG